MAAKTEEKEAKETEPVIRLEIDGERCKGCELCVPFCPRNLLYMSDELNTKGYRVVAITSQEECTSCMSCALMCPDVALRVWRVRREEG
jgi:2-oxoglutarate ferredoxin oxidoreductase subunit delta